MKFSLRLFLLTCIALAVLLALSWRDLAERFTEYEVVRGNSTAFQHIGYVKSAACLRASGHPSLIVGRAWSDYVAELDGDNVPYIAVIKHNDNVDFKFQSLTSAGPGVAVTTTLSVDNIPFLLEHKLDRRDSNKSDKILVDETLLFNGEKLSLSNGRLFVISLIDGKLEIKQHQIGNVNKAAFFTETSIAKERLKPALSWWRSTRHKLD